MNVMPNLKATEYRLYVQEEIRKGLESASNGELIDEEEIESRMRQFLNKHEGQNTCLTPNK
jgi:predicted transcriptional regulator